MVVLFPIFVSIALQVCSCDARVGAWIDSAAGDCGVWSHPRARIGFRAGFGYLRFWGQVLIGLFSAYRSGFRSIEQADVLLVAAFIACSYGYAEGGLLAREMGGWLVICWALVTVLPLELIALACLLFWHGVRIGRQPRRHGRVCCTSRGQPIHRVFLLLQGSRPGRHCEDEPGAIALAVPRRSSRRTGFWARRSMAR